MQLQGRLCQQAHRARAALEAVRTGGDGAQLAPAAGAQRGPAAPDRPAWTDGQTPAVGREAGADAARVVAPDWQPEAGVAAQAQEARQRELERQPDTLGEAR